MADDLKNLPPEERIKRLKELEVKKKREMEEKQKAIEQERKEIEDAAREIKNAEGELNARQKVKEKVPIVEVAAESGEGLSEEAKIILKSMQKKIAGMKEERGREGEQKEGQEEKKESKSKEWLGGLSRSALEETVQQERKISSGQFSSGANEYITSLSKQPAAQLYQHMSTLYQAVETKGYMNAEEQRRVQYISSAMEKKLEDVGAGKYSLTEEAARATSLTQQMSEVVRGMYKSGTVKKAKELNWYKSG